VYRRRRQSVQISGPEEDSAGEGASEGEQPLAKRKTAKAPAEQKTGKARGKAEGREARAGPSKKVKRAAAPENPTPSETPLASLYLPFSAAGLNSPLHPCSVLGQRVAPNLIHPIVPKRFDQCKWCAQEYGSAAPCWS